MGTVHFTLIFHTKMKHEVSKSQREEEKKRNAVVGVSSEVSMSQFKFKINRSGGSNKVPLDMEALAPRKTNSSKIGRQDFQRVF